MLLTEDKKLPQNRIAELRKKKKLSQAQLAKETGLGCQEKRKGHRRAAPPQ